MQLGYTQKRFIKDRTVRSKTKLFINSESGKQFPLVFWQRATCHKLFLVQLLYVQEPYACLGLKPQDGKELTLSEIYHKLLLEKEHEKFCLMT